MEPNVSESVLGRSERRCRRGSRQGLRPAHPLPVLSSRILGATSPLFDAMYANGGRPSIPPEKPLRARLLQMLYSVRCVRPPEPDVHVEHGWTAFLHRYCYTFRTAASAAVASAVTASKNAWLWPSNRPEFTKPVAAATAPAILLFRGLMVEQTGKLGSMKV